MQKKLLPEAEQYVSQNQRRRTWQKFVHFMACVVVFCTTYALILPAITMEQSTECQLEEHIHLESCYTKVEIPQEDTDSLTCELIETEGHSHVEECYDEDAQLICTEQTEAHTHSNLCYGTWELVCELEEHSHSSHEIATIGATVNGDGSIAWTIQNVNYYAPGEVVLIDGYTVEEFSNASYATNFDPNNPMDADAKASFVDNQPTFVGYTAVIIENLDNGQDDGNQYYVDAVISCTSSTIMNPGVSMINLAPKTYNGYIVYIPNEMLTAATMPNRGDLVDPDFWHASTDVINGYRTAGNIFLEDNPASSEVLAEANPADINATIKMFDYDSSINETHPDGFLFWNGDYGYGADVESEDGWGADFILVDGEYEGAWPFEGGNITMDAYHGYNKFPTVSSTLSNDKYPVLIDKTPGEEGNLVELDYLFDETYQIGEQMTDGGGLFQKDSEGYYYYDSLQNATYFNGSRFVLYEDLIVRPWADSKDSSMQAYGNFLPLNPITTGNITPDGYVYSDDLSTITGTTDWTGSLVMGAGQSVNSANATLSSGGNNRLKEVVYNTDKTTARLEDKSNLWFGMSVDFEFYQPENGLIDSTDDGVDNAKDMIFDFHGDDDVLVYVGVWNEETKAYDYKLTLDLSGVHEARSGNINFATGEVFYEKHNAENPGSETIPGAGITVVNTTLKEIFDLTGDTFHDYTKLSIKFFYLERGGNISYCRLRFNIPTLPDNSLTVTKELKAGENIDDDVFADYIEDTLSYEFRIVQADAEGNATSTSYFQKATTDEYGNTIYIPELVEFDILENGTVVGQGNVDENGAFRLRAGQSARFYNMHLWSQNDTIKYVVQEILPKDLVGQYESVDYIAGLTTGSIPTDDQISQDFTSYNTIAFDPDHFQYVVYRNKVDITKLSGLKITKEQSENTQFSEDKEFLFQVLLDGTPIADGTEYKVGETIKTAETVKVNINGVETAVSGIIRLKVGETANLVKGILSGTKYTVKEIIADGDGFWATYSGTVTSADGTADLTGEEGITDQFPLASVVHVTVANADYASMVEIPLEKTYEGNISDAEDFVFDIVQVDENGEPLADAGEMTGTTIHVTDGNATSGKILIKYNGNFDGIYYYKITERPGNLYAIYDTISYIVEVKVEGNTATIVSINGKVYDNEVLAFVNRKLTDITISKTVTGAAAPENLEFNFTAMVKNSDGTSFTPSAGDGYEVAEDGTITFSLVHTGTVTIKGIPIGATVTVKEADMTGFMASYTVNGEEETMQSNSATITVVNGATIDFINYNGYELPETGGAGTTTYTMAGWMLMFFSAAYLLYRYIKHRREVV